MFRLTAQRRAQCTCAIAMLQARVHCGLPIWDGCDVDDDRWRHVSVLFEPWGTTAGGHGWESFEFLLSEHI